MKHRGSATHTSTHVSKLLLLHCRRFPAWLSPPSFLLLNIPFSLYNPSLFAVVLLQFQPRLSTFHPFSATLLHNNPPRPPHPPSLLSLQCSSSKMGRNSRGDKPSLRKCHTVSGGWGVERELREDELPLRDATPRSALLRWGVVMEENSAMMLGGCRRIR